jgi:hypothetical protein
MTFKHSVSEMKKEEKKGRRGRERERERERAQMGEMNFADTQIEERERTILFTFFILVWGKKTKKKKVGGGGGGAYYLFFFFLGINWSYFTMSLLYWGIILEALSFYGKKIWALFLKKK